MQIPDPKFKVGQRVVISPGIHGTVERQDWMCSRHAPSHYWRYAVRLLKESTYSWTEEELDPVEPEGDSDLQPAKPRTSLEEATDEWVQALGEYYGKAD